MQLSRIGNVVEGCWLEIRFHFPFVKLNNYVIMPNHIHGIRSIIAHQVVDITHKSLSQVKHQDFNPKGPPSRSLSAIIGSFTSAVTKQVHRLGLTHQKSIWQQNHYEPTTEMMKIINGLLNISNSIPSIGRMIKNISSYEDSSRIVTLSYIL